MQLRWRSGSLVLALGLMIFLAAKGWFVLGQTAAMGMPRLGDDAFTHLWRAKQIERVGILGAWYGEGEKAFRGAADIGELCGIDEPDSFVPGDPGSYCARVADNVAAADVKVVASVLLDAAMHIGLTWKWSYALFELLVAGIFAGSLAYLLVRLFDPAAAGLALIFLAFLTTMPPQGLHQFVASTLAIGLSLALWGLVIRRRSLMPGIAAIGGACALSLIHPVALVYGAGLVVLVAPAWRQRMTPRHLLLLVALGLTASVILLLTDNPVRQVLADALTASALDVLRENAAALPDRLTTFAAQNAGFVAAVAVAIGFLWWRRLVDTELVLVLSALAALLCAAMFSRTEFFLFTFELDLFARIFIGLAAIGCGVLGAALVSLWRQGSMAHRLPVAVAVCLVPIPSAMSWTDAFYDNLNGRSEVVEEAALEAAIGSYPPETAIAYAELEISPTAVFLAGGADHGAVPLKGLDEQALREALEARRPEVVVLPNFRLLNSMAIEQSQSLQRRRYGISAEAVDLVSIATPGATIRRLYVQVESEDDRPAHIGPVRYEAAGQQGEADGIVVAPRTRRWVVIELDPARPAQSVSLSLPPSKVWITGFSVNRPPRPTVDWPWEAKATVQWRFRGSDDGEAASVTLAFTLPALFAHWDAPGLDLVAYPLHRSVTDDSSGLVFVQTFYALTD